MNEIGKIFRKLIERYEDFIDELINRMEWLSPINGAAAREYESESGILDLGQLIESASQMIRHGDQPKVLIFSSEKEKNSYLTGVEIFFKMKNKIPRDIQSLGGIKLITMSDPLPQFEEN